MTATVFGHDLVHALGHLDGDVPCTSRAGTDVDGLEEAWDRDEQPRCGAKVHAVIGGAPGHTCTTIARWSCHNPCTGCTVLWCDGRYARHLEIVRAGWTCVVCHGTADHWTVTAL